MYEILKNREKQVRENVKKFTMDLINVPSMSLHEDAVADLVEKEMKSLGYDRVFQDIWGNVIGIINGKNSESAVILNSHMDTVDPEKMDNWTRDAFCASDENGRIYGSGASDCKSGLAAQIYAGAVLKHSLLPLKNSIVIAATVAEENGRSIGVRGLIEDTLPSLNITPSNFILGEPTGTGLFYGHDGWVKMDIHIEGEKPFQVEDVARSVYENLEEASVYENNANDKDIFSIEVPYYKDEMGIRKATIHLSQKLYNGDNFNKTAYNLKKSVSNIARNFGSVAVNVMVQEEFQKTYTGKTVTVPSITDAWSMAPYHPLIERSRQTLAAAGQFVKPEKFQLNKLEMGTAGSLLVNEFKIPTIAYGPGELSQAHEADEYVEINNISKAVLGTAAIVHGLAGYPVFGWTSEDI
jgi:acetylornithine deacetylase/succinyl-diaminopimelate desuccinylase-like protein